MARRALADLFGPVEVVDAGLGVLRPASGASCWVYATGTTTSVTVYADGSSSTTLTLPVTTNSQGEPPGYVATDQDIDLVSVYKGNTTTSTATSLTAADVAGGGGVSALTSTGLPSSASQIPQSTGTASRAVTWESAVTTSQLPGAAVTDSSGADSISVVTQTGSPSSSRRRGLRDFLSLADYTTAAMRAGNADATAAMLQWMIDCGALKTTTGYGDSQGVRAYAPAGMYTFSQGISVIPGVKLVGDGPRSTIFRVGSTFNDIAVVKGVPQGEYFTAEGFTCWGSHGNNTPVNAANAGVSTTISSITQSGTSHSGLNLAGSVPFQLGLTSTSGWATSGYALVNGTVRVIYDGITSGVLQNCFITNGYAILSTGQSVAPITTNNVHCLYVPPCGTPSHIEGIEAQFGSASSILAMSPNCVAFRDIWAQESNRDAFLVAGTPRDLEFSNICAQYPGIGGGTFACLHILGHPAGAFIQGGLKFSNLYFESSIANSPGLWLQDICDVMVDGVRLSGNVFAGPYTGQVTVQIDSEQTSPLTNDMCHSYGVDIRNISTTGIASGRISLVDNIRGHTFTAPGSNDRYQHPRYAPDNQDWWGAAPFQANLWYAANQLTLSGGAIYQRNADGFAGSSFAADSSNWTAVSGGNAIADRERTLRLGTLASLRETVPGAIWNKSIANTSLAITSGTQQGAVIPVVKGESYGHVAFTTGSTGATFASNLDGHWYVAIYDASGNLVTQTADQGTASLASGTTKKLALNATITPAADALYTAVLMVYIGTGTGGVMPTILSGILFTLGSILTGMPVEAITANAGQTTGTAPGTLGATTSVSGPLWIALYT